MTLSLVNTGCWAAQWSLVSSSWRQVISARKGKGLSVRGTAHPDNYLPPTPTHSLATGRFRAPAIAADPTFTDLGMWNVYANTDFPAPQQRLQDLMCANPPCDPAQVLPLTIGRFKTPTLRDLGHSQPYLHTGRMDSVEKVLDFYRHTALLAQAGQLRNADPNIAGISIDAQDSAALAAFLASLNEDYD